MKKFNIQNELKQIIENKKLIELDINGIEDLIYGYFLKANEEYLALAVINSNGMLVGITMCRMEDVNLISTESNFINEMAKLVDRDNVYAQVLKEIENIIEFTFIGFASYLQDTKTVAAVTRNNQENIEGRIVGFDENFMVVDEYAAGKDKKVARTYFPFDDITRISIGSTLLKATSRYLAENNL
ncbi:MAG: hypothetical protein WDZ94_03230 [Patescibacteria group bacterium]